MNNRCGLSSVVRPLRFARVRDTSGSVGIERTSAGMLIDSSESVRYFSQVGRGDGLDRVTPSAAMRLGVAVPMRGTAAHSTSFVDVSRKHHFAPLGQGLAVHQLAWARIGLETLAPPGRSHPCSYSLDIVMKALLLATTL